MIVVILMGGLGNQMFQYAAGRALAFRLNAELRLDRSWFSPQLRSPDDTPRDYSFHVFPSIQPQFTATEESYFRAAPTLWDRVVKRGCRVLARIRGTYTPEPRCIIESDVADLEVFRKITAPCKLVGYWQREDFFGDAAFWVRKDFTFPPLPTKAQHLADTIGGAANAIAVHVRRGDYVNSAGALKMHGLCPPQYYAEALTTIARVTEDAQCFLFSDDPAWVREHFDTQGLPATVVDLHGEADAHHDMHLMSLCKHHVIANSSFSWWGAWLAQTGGMTIAPKQWFADPSMADRDPCPERWIRI